MERVAKFLKDAETYYLATVEGDQPRVRPFGTAHIFEGKLYIQTGKVKDVSKQIHANPKVEICAFMNGEWLRVAGELVEVHFPALFLRRSRYHIRQIPLPIMYRRDLHDWHQYRSEPAYVYQSLARYFSVCRRY